MYRNLLDFVIEANIKKSVDVRACQTFLRGSTRFQLNQNNHKQKVSTIPVYLISRGQGNPFNPVEGNHCPCKISDILMEIDECFQYFQTILKNEGIEIDEETFEKIKEKAEKDCQKRPKRNIDDQKRIDFNEKRYLYFNEKVREELGFKSLSVEEETSEEDMTRKNFLQLKKVKEKLSKLIDEERISNISSFKDEFGEVYEALANNKHKTKILKHYDIQDRFSEEKEFQNATILGAYFNNRSNGKNYIEIYLDPIYTFAKSTGLHPYLVYRQVLIHELAHAYHHRGIDANGNIWTDFFKSPGKGTKSQIDNVLEGLSQWYAFEYMIDLDIKSEKKTSVYTTYKKGKPFDNVWTMIELCNHQSSTYNYFKPWLQYTRENLRRVIMSSRVDNMLTFESDFEKLLKNNHRDGH